MVGTGVSIGATADPRASWKGLLLDGLSRIESFGVQGPEVLASERVLIEEAFSGEFKLDEILRRAESMIERFGGADDPRFAAWLKDSVGSLTTNPNDRLTLDAIADLARAGALILTTNYDNLLCEATGFDFVTWEEPARIIEVVNRQCKAVIHIHGHWSRPSSIVLGRTSYDRIKEVALAQTELRHLWLHWHWLYLGCGGGLADPNFGALLQWGREVGLGESAMRSFFLTAHATIGSLPAPVVRSTNLTTHAYGDHTELPGLLRELTPEARCAPFERVGPSGRRLRRVDESPLASPFPSWQEFIDGEVPALAADEEVLRRLDVHGWAFVLDTASVGKTTLAYRIAARPEYRGKPAYHLLLSDIFGDDNLAVSVSPQSAVSRLARQGVLLIIDDANLQPELAHTLWQQWRERPTGSKLMLLATRIGHPVNLPGESSLYDLETYPENPAVQLRPSPADLLPIALYVLRRLGLSAAALAPPPDAIAAWHETFGREMGAFVVAVSQRRFQLSRGDFTLPASAAAQWVRARHLRRLNGSELANAVCLAVLGEQGLELDVPVECLPNPAEVGRLQETGLVQHVLVAGRYSRYRLREPEWGRLILAALATPPDRNGIILNAASNSILFAATIASRLKGVETTEQYAMLWRGLEMPAYSDRLTERALEAPLGPVAAFLKAAENEGRGRFVDKLWRALGAQPEKLAEQALSGDLHIVVRFLNTAADRGQQPLVEQLWEQFAARPVKVAEAAFVTPLDWVAEFIVAAREAGRNELAKGLWAALESQPERLVERAFENPLNRVAAFLDTARKQRRSQLVDGLWEALAAQPEKVAERALSAHLHFFLKFINIAKDQGQQGLVDRVWTQIAAQPAMLAQAASETPLDPLADFIVAARKAGKAEMAEEMWRALEAQPDLVERALENPLHLVARFLNTAGSEGRSQLVDRLWGAMAAQPDRFVEYAFALPLNNLALLLVSAGQQGRRELVARVWKASVAQPEMLAMRVFSSTLNTLVQFLKVAEQQVSREVVETLWKLIGASPERLVECVLASSISDLRGFLLLAAQQDQSEAIEGVWRAVSAQPDRLAARASTQSPGSLMSFLVLAPEELRRAIIQRLRVEDWAYGPYRTNRFSTGAPGLAGQFGRNGREDLKVALVDNLLRRKALVDFSDPRSALIEMSRLLALTTPDQETDLVGLLDRVCTDAWLETALQSASLFSLAGALGTIAIHQPPRIIRYFWHACISVRLEAPFSRAEVLNDQELSAAVQLLGTSQLAGWTVDRTILVHAPWDRIGQLPSLVPHRPEAKIVQQWQRQLWLGLRAAASIGPGSVNVEGKAIGETLDLWRWNIEGAGDWPGTRLDQASTAHRINLSMVEWLEKCWREGSGQLLAAEPLWLLAGFPADPKRLDAEAHVLTIPPGPPDLQ